MGTPDYLNKVDQYKRELSVLVARYVQRVLMGDAAGYQGEQTKKFPQQRNLTTKDFRDHTNNVEEIVGQIIDRYSEEVFYDICHRMSGSRDLDEEGEDPFPALPLDKNARYFWFRRALAKWNKPLH